MKEVVIKKNRVMKIVEGLSVDIAQKNGDKVPFESLWASQDDINKLSLYYREAISDLERQVVRRLGVSHAQFTLTDNEDYVLKVTISNWPEVLNGLLSNKAQDYFVHSILAGWLNGFSGLEIKADYAAMAKQDLSDITTLLNQKSFNFGTNERSGDNNNASSNVVSSNERKTDGNATEQKSESVNERTEESAVVDSNGQGPDTSVRLKDDCHKNLLASREPPRHRHQDTVPVRHHRDTVDWSGEGMEVMMFRFGMPPMPVRHRHPDMCDGCEMPPENPNCEAETGRSAAGECDTREEWEF